MRTILVHGARGTAVLLGAVLATASFGDPPRPGSAPSEPVKPAVLVPSKEVPSKPPAAEGDRVYRMELYEGPNRTVRYFGVGASPSERAALNDLARAENEMDYVNKLQNLRRLYVNNEITLQPQRLYVQEQLYGTQISYGWNSMLAGYGFGGGGGYGPGWNWGVNDYISGYPMMGWGGGYGYPGGGFAGYLGGASTNVVRSLAFGMGDEGVLKNQIAPVIAQQMASPEYAAAVSKNYHAALAEVANHPRLARGLGLKKGDVAEVAGPPETVVKPRSAAVTLTLKGGEKVEGNTLAEEGDWYVVTTPRGETKVRKSEVTRIERVKAEK
jgi:hypothetical protein